MPNLRQLLAIDRYVLIAECLILQGLFLFDSRKMAPSVATRKVFGFFIFFALFGSLFFGILYYFLG